MKDKIIKLIEDAGDAFGNQLQRNIAIGSVTRNFTIESERNQLIKQIEEDDHHADVSQIIFEGENGVIFLQRTRKNDNYGKGFPYRVAIKTEKRGWKMLNTVCDTVDSAMVLYLAEKGGRPNMVDAVIQLLNVEVKDFE